MAMESKNVKEIIPFVPENNSVQVVSRDNVHRIHDANDPVVVYKSLVAAKETVRISANSKLSALGKQMDFLIKEANKIVEKSKRDEQLHNIPCNFKKNAGNVYYLYKRRNGTEFFSMLSPDEWGRQLNKFEYVGGYRLDGDYGFTCVDGPGAVDGGTEEERMKRRNREGVFNNAIYSKIVRAAEETDVLLGVEEDLEFITKKNPYDDSRVWNNAPGSASGSVMDNTLPPIRQPGRGLGRLRRTSDFFVTRTIKPGERRKTITETEESEESPIYVQNDEPRRKYNVGSNMTMRNGYREVRRSKDIFKKPEVPTKKPRGASIFESIPMKEKPRNLTTSYVDSGNLNNFSLDEVASRVSEHLPKLPLRIGHSLCYADLVSDLCKKNLKTDESSLDITKGRINALNDTVGRAAKAYSEYMKKTDMTHNTSEFNTESPLTHASPPSSQQSFQLESASMVSAHNSTGEVYGFEKTFKLSSQHFGVEDYPSDKSSSLSSNNSNSNSFAFYGLDDLKNWPDSTSRSSSDASKSTIKFLEPGFIG